MSNHSNGKSNERLKLRELKWKWQKLVCCLLFQSLSYANVGLFMSSDLGQVQFQKKPETEFRIVDEGKCDERLESNECLCRNYQDSVKRRVRKTRIKNILLLILIIINSFISVTEHFSCNFFLLLRKQGKSTAWCAYNFSQLA